MAKRQRQKERLDSVAVGIVHGHNIEGVFFDSFVRLMTKRPDVVSEVISVHSGPQLHHGRNELTKAFLEQTKAKWLLCLDSDMVFDADHVVEMLRTVRDHPQVKILGGLTWICQDPRPGPENMKSNLWSHVGKPEDATVGAVTKFPMNALVTVAATGAACLLIHREVFEKVGALTPKPQWWNHLQMEMPNGDVDMLGEDISFCVKARDCEYEIFVHTGIEFGHTKRLVLDSRLMGDTLNADEPKESSDDG